MYHDFIFNSKYLLTVYETLNKNISIRIRIQGMPELNEDLKIDRDKEKETILNTILKLENEMTSSDLLLLNGKPFFSAFRISY